MAEDTLAIKILADFYVTVTKEEGDELLAFITEHGHLFITYSALPFETRVQIRDALLKQPHLSDLDVKTGNQVLGKFIARPLPALFETQSEL